MVGCLMHAAGGEKTIYARIYIICMSENQVQSACKRLANLEKACIRMPWDALEKKQAASFCLVTVRISFRGVSQNKIDEDGE